jgi:hydroxymethylpyrimidine/phosphomethylpyrimidine kinase
MDKVPKSLTIAGSDSGGGAGIQADLKTFSALGVHGSCVITAITAQNSKGVTAVHNVPVEIIEAQIDAIMSDIGTNSVKIGMLSNSEIIRAVSKKIREYGISDIILDPVIFAASGSKLLQGSAIESLKKELTPISKIITPNILEAEILGGFKIKNKEEMLKAGKEILKLGSSSVLLKGGHLRVENSDFLTDLLITDNETTIFENKKIEKEGHGTGCTLSSAIAAHMAMGKGLKNAVKESIDYVHKALEYGYKAGSLNFVLNHNMENKIK